jgi:hypothetical protein
MSGIEPNIQALVWFIALWSICCLGFLQLAGLYPLRQATRPHMPNLLVLAATMLWIVTLAATLHFAVTELRWTTIVIVAGVLLLFVPEIFQALPRRFRDGISGLTILAFAFVAALLLLAHLTSNMIPST